MLGHIFIGRAGSFKRRSLEYSLSGRPKTICEFRGAATSDNIHTQQEAAEAVRQPGAISFAE